MGSLNTIKNIYVWMKGNILIVLGAALTLITMLWRRESNKATEQEAQAQGAEKRGEVNELQKETKGAESDYASKLDAYKRARDAYRESGND